MAAYQQVLFQCPHAEATEQDHVAVIFFPHSRFDVELTVDAVYTAVVVDVAMFLCPGELHYIVLCLFYF